MSDISLDEAKLWHVEDGHDITDSVAFHGPPGTGKTTTCAATVGRLLRDHGYEIGDVCWATYRRQLATDTLDRLHDWDVIAEEQLQNPRKGATRLISTTHAIGNRIADIGEQPADIGHKIQFCRRRDMQFTTSEPWEDSAGKLLFSTFSWLRSANTDPSDSEMLRECPHTEDLFEHWDGNVYSAWLDWEDYKAQRELIDFGEMLQIPLQNGQSPGRPILVIDEYHDVTGLMHQLFQQWMADAEIVLVAGDPHQVVNAYQGASPHYFESLELPEVLLPKSWRVPEEHWQLATQMLAQAHNPPEVERDGRGLLKQYRSPRFEYSSESGWVRTPDPDEAGGPARVHREYPGSTLFLTRTQMQADGVGRALERAGVPYRSQRELRGWNTDDGEPVWLLHNALQRVRPYGPGDFGHSAEAGLGQFETSGAPDPRHTTLTPSEAALLLDASNARTLDMSRGDATDKAADLRQSDTAVDLREFDEWVAADWWSQYTSGASSVGRLNRSALGGGTDADRAQNAIKAALRRHDEPIQMDDISCWAITIHASKGMEADDVVVYDGVSGRIQREMMQDEQTRKNEMRTWFVALTRADSRLHLMRGGFGWTNELVPRPREVLSDA